MISLSYLSRAEYKSRLTGYMRGKSIYILYLLLLLFIIIIYRHV